MSFFFFQAEDGIRDFHVTGVQTCALPISQLARAQEAVEVEQRRRAERVNVVGVVERVEHRSEERRVGKECRCRWSPNYRKKKRGANKARSVERFKECCKAVPLVVETQTLW